MEVTGQMEQSGECTLPVLEGDIRDLASALEQHRNVIARYVRNMVRDSADAEDLIQETFIRAVRQQGTLRDQDALLSWLYRIATHVCLDHLRQKARMRDRQHEQPAEELPIEDVRAESPLQLVQRNEMSECVQRYVAQLSDNYRAALMLHDVDGASAIEIAQLLDLPLSTVKMRIHRARRNLQSLLHEACGFRQDNRGVLVCDPKTRVED